MASLALFQSNALTDALNNTEWVFPLAECIHILFFALAIGTIVIVDLRLMGLAFPRQSAAQLLQDTWVYTLVGLVVTVFAGMALFISDANMYYFHRWFRFKAALLFVAIVYNYTVHYKVASSSPSQGMGVVVGALSVLLWASVVLCGIFIGLVY